MLRGVPKRADLVLARVHERSIGPVVEPTEHGLDPVPPVHTSPFVEFLSTAWDDWVAAHGEYDALPLTWPTRGAGTTGSPARSTAG
ncbi:MAG: hypothetical protein R2713_16135 [Ilumatobacteraceae bacterium]